MLISLLTAASLAAMTAGGVTAALVSWQTYKDMRDIKKELRRQRLASRSAPKAAKRRR